MRDAASSKHWSSRRRWIRRDPGSRTERVRPRRVFFALWPDASFCTRLRAATAPHLERLEGRHPNPSDWHVTMCFVGAVTEEALAVLLAGAAAISARSFALQFDRFEFWREARVVAVTASQVPAPALELAQALRTFARSVGLAPDEKPLRPHMTLARGVSPLAWRTSCEGRSRSLDAPLDFMAGRFHLAESLPAALTADGGGESGPEHCDASMRGEAAADALHRHGHGNSYVCLASWPLRS